MESMTKEQAGQLDEVDEELIDTLIAISVVAKRLANKLRRQNEEIKKEENPSG